jgi:hypothetical protein
MIISIENCYLILLLSNRKLNVNYHCCHVVLLFYLTYLPEVCISYEDLLLFNVLQVCTAVMVVLLIVEDYQ